MKRSPALATVMVVFFLAAVPVLLIRRLVDGLLPTQAYDVVLGVALIAWMLVSKAVLDRNDRMDRLIENRLSPQWQAASLVEQSMLGVGFVPKVSAQETATDPRLYQLSSPDASIDAFMPPALPEPESGRGLAQPDERGRPRLQPTIRQTERAAPPILATEEYSIVRSDTLWSIAEARLNDGRRWTDVEDINIGREVAPGVFFHKGDNIRIGWSILVPVAIEIEADA